VLVAVEERLDEQPVRSQVQPVGLHQNPGHPLDSAEGVGVAFPHLLWVVDPEDEVAGGAQGRLEDDGVTELGARRHSVVDAGHEPETRVRGTAAFVSLAHQQLVTTGPGGFDADAGQAHGFGDCCDGHHGGLGERQDAVEGLLSVPGLGRPADVVDVR
jgi:hypothetical protein